MNFARYLGVLLKFTALAVAAVICGYVLYAATYFAISRSYRADSFRLIGLYDVARNIEKSSYYPDPYQDRDLSTVLPHHRAIAEWVQRCMGINPNMRLPPVVMTVFWTPSESESTGAYESNETWPNGVRLPFRLEMSLLKLSSDLSEERLQLIAKVRSSYLFWQTATLVSIFIGMITTILVSVSSTSFGQGEGYRQRLIRVLAIIFPALGTATAAVIGFYSPQAEWGQASRSLASETQLHGQMAQAVWKFDCLNGNNDDHTSRLLNSALDEWSKRIVDIQTIAAASSTSNGAQGSGAQGSGAQGSGAQGSGAQGGGAGGNQSNARSK